MNFVFAQQPHIKKRKFAKAIVECENVIHTDPK